jgi:flagellar motor switch protein FliN
MSADALSRLGRQTAEAVTGVLEMFAPGRVTLGDVTVVPGERSPLESLAIPAVATSVSYVDGVTGGNVLVTTLDAARKLAAAMMGAEEPEAQGAAELTELELSAVAEAMNQMMASAAGATSSVLGTEVEIGPPETQTFTSVEQAVAAYPPTPHAIRAAFTVFGEPCRLIQLVPTTVVVRMTSALDELGAEVPAQDGPAATPHAGGRPSLAGIPVRVSAELGRARMASAEVVGLPPGSVVELNRQADEPIDLYVNGKRFATGRLVVVDGSEWAVRIEQVLPTPNPEPNSRMEAARWPESW